LSKSNRYFGFPLLAYYRQELYQLETGQPKTS